MFANLVLQVLHKRKQLLWNVSHVLVENFRSLQVPLFANGAQGGPTRM